jgi:hypothetical protein
MVSYFYSGNFFGHHASGSVTYYLHEESSGPHSYSKCSADPVQLELEGTQLLLIIIR